MAVCLSHLLLESPLALYLGDYYGAARGGESEGLRGKKQKTDVHGHKLHWAFTPTSKENRVQTQRLKMQCIEMLPQAPSVGNVRRARGSAPPQKKRTVEDSSPRGQRLPPNG